MDYMQNSASCVTFVQATDSSPNYVLITTDHTCSSELGMRGGEQKLTMNRGCFNNGLVDPVHLLLHTLGFPHEHNRTLVLTEC